MKRKLKTGGALLMAGIMLFGTISVSAANKTGYVIPNSTNYVNINVADNYGNTVNKVNMRLMDNYGITVAKWTSGNESNATVSGVSLVNNENKNNMPIKIRLPYQDIFGSDYENVVALSVFDSNNNEISTDKLSYSYQLYNPLVSLKAGNSYKATAKFYAKDYDMLLPANEVRVYSTSAYDGDSCGIIIDNINGTSTDKTIDFTDCIKNYQSISLNAGWYSTYTMCGSGYGTGNNIKVSDKPCEYIKVKAKMSDFDSQFNADGTVTDEVNGTNYNYNFGNDKKGYLSTLVIASGSVVCGVTPDSNGYITFYVNTNDYEVCYSTDYSWPNGGGGGGVTSRSFGNFVKYTTKDYSFSTESLQVPKTGINLYNIPAGEYTLRATSNVDGYKAVKDQQITISATGQIQKLSYNLTKQDYVSMGDVNSDGKITLHDVVNIQNYMTGFIKLNDKQFFAGDLNKDDNVSILEAMYLQKYIAGISNECQIGERVKYN